MSLGVVRSVIGQEETPHSSVAMINLPEEYSNEDHECREYPDDKDPLVENVVQSEAHVGGQLLKAAHVFFHLEQVSAAQCSKGDCIF